MTCSEKAIKTNARDGTECSREKRHKKLDKESQRNHSECQCLSDGANTTGDACLTMHVRFNTATIHKSEHTHVAAVGRGSKRSSYGVVASWPLDDGTTEVMF